MKTGQRSVFLELFHYACAQDTASNVDSYSVYGLDENHLYGTVHAQGKEAVDANSKVTATIYTHVTKKLSIDELISQVKEEKLRKRTFQLDPPKVPSKASKDPA